MCPTTSHDDVFGTYVELALDQVPVLFDDLLTGTLLQFFDYSNLDAPNLIPLVFHMFL